MAGTRKSDFSGDRYGDWVVMSRAPAANGKRCWVVQNTQTDETGVVLQTDLPGLGRVSVNAESNFEREEAPLAPGEGWASDLEVDATLTHEIEIQEPQRIRTDADPIIAPPLPADHPIRKSITYTPKGDQAESALIMQAVMGQPPAMDFAAASGSLVDEGWAADLCVETGDAIEKDGIVAASRTEEQIAQIKELQIQLNAANEVDPAVICTNDGEPCPSGRHGTLPVAPYDTEEVQRTQDPVRVALRQAMGGLNTARNVLDQKVALLAVSFEELEAAHAKVMEALDQALKASIVK